MRMGKMKKLLLTVLLLQIVNTLFAQSGIDTSLHFNQRYTQCERRWVVIPKKDTAQSYMFGFVYIDEQAGFSFRLKGNFKVDKSGHYIADTSITANTSLTYRIAPTFKNIALLPASRFAELNIEPQPGWIKGYYHYTDTLAHNFRWGFFYNDAGQCDTALVYLNKVYQKHPHYARLEFEMIFAHNVLGDYNGAIKIIQAALDADPTNVLFYRELGYAYMKQKSFDKSISAYKTGISMCTAGETETKSEMAINLAGVYKVSGDEANFKVWGAQAKSWAKPGTELYNFIVGQGF